MRIASAAIARADQAKPASPASPGELQSRAEAIVGRE
jgi:hypothetical protein